MFIALILNFFDHFKNCIQLIRLVLVELAACWLASKMLEHHGPFWSQRTTFKTDLGLSPSILEADLSAK